MATAALPTTVYVRRPVPDDVPWTSPGCFHVSEDCAANGSNERGSETAELSVDRARKLGYRECGRCV